MIINTNCCLEEGSWYFREAWGQRNYTNVGNRRDNRIGKTGCSTSIRKETGSESTVKSNPHRGWNELVKEKDPDPGNVRTGVKGKWQLTKNLPNTGEGKQRAQEEKRLNLAGEI